VAPFLAHPVDIKEVAYNRVTAILKRCRKGQNFVIRLLLLFLLRHTVTAATLFGRIGGYFVAAN